MARFTASRFRFDLRRLRLGWLRRPGMIVLKTLAIVLPLGGLVVGLAYARLMQGPVSMYFLLPPLERALNGELPGLTIDIEDAIVRLSDGGGFEFRLKNVRVDEADGDAVALAPLAAVHLSGRALLSGRIAPARVELIEPRILIARNADGQFSLSFAKTADATTSSSPPSDQSSGSVVGTSAASPSDDDPAALPRATPWRRIDLARTYAEISARARRREDAASFLEQVGFKNAAVIYDADGRRSIWRLPTFDVTLNHKQKRSIVSGEATVASAEAQWSFSFRAVDSTKTNTVRLDASVHDFRPRAAVRGSPHFVFLNAFDLPISASGSLELGTDGHVRDGHFVLDFEPGQVHVPGLDHAPSAVGSGRLDVRYSGEREQFDLGPSTFAWGDSQAVVGGTIGYVAAGENANARWQFDLRSLGGVIAAKDLGVPPLKIERWSAKGRIDSDAGIVNVDTFALDAGGARVDMTGRIANMTGRIDARLEGRFGEMPISALKALWPSLVAPRTRAWVGPNLTKGILKSGSFVLATSRDVEIIGSPTDPADRRLSLTLEGTDLGFNAMAGMPPIEAPRGLLRVEGSQLEVTIPEASIAAGNGESISLRSGRLMAENINADQPLAEISVRGQAPLTAVLDLLRREPIGVAQINGLDLASIDGKLEGQVKLTAPIGDVVSGAAVKLEGKARISDGRAKNIFGGRDIHGASLLITATEKTVDITGDMLLAGVNMSVGLQRLIGVPDAQQPPIKISAKLDNSDRNQLGLDLNHMVQGEVPLEITIQQTALGTPHVRLVGDLTGAELRLDDVSWRKPPGRQATVKFDAVPGRVHKTELQNFKVFGDNIAIDGWVGLGADNEPDEFHFPDFSLNVVTNLDVQGKMRPGRVWNVKASGRIYDGNDLFRSLIAFGQLTDTPVPHAKERPGLDLTAEIDTVLGASDTTIRGVKLKMQKRAEQLTMLDLQGTLESGKPLVARLRPAPGNPRRIVAETADAGQALKLIGFYPNMLGGSGELEIDLDGRGAAERSGVLAIHNFRVLGDPIVSEVLQSPDDGRPAIGTSQRRRRVVREQFEFDRLRAPFSMGNGQLVLANAHVAGPVVGATMRGKVDYRSRSLQLGGTYVPLSGLNSSFAPIPLLGPLLTGPRGEGVLGITFAIQGPMADPQVIVNPFSLVMPGIFREIFQMTPENPRITPRDKRSAPRSRAGGPQVRASPPSSGSTARNTRQTSPEVLGGWSSETSVPPN